MPAQTNDATRVHVIASQHLDVAWLWTRVPQGEDLMRQCFEMAADMIEADPTGRFVFSRSTAWSFWIVQQRYPQLFERVRQHVASGRLELCGGEWVEPDHLIPDGESLIRQMALGQWYFQATFGKTARVCWDPDVFGHPNTLPQIVRKAGMGGYYFHRCRPRDAEGNPLHQFLWEGLDGSTIAGLSGQWIGKPEPARLRQAVAEDARTGLPATHVVCGANSDRRITMTPAWVALPDEWQADPELADCHWSTAGAVLADMQAYADRLPLVRGELGFSYTGTYTSNRHNKRWIRRLESGLVQAEQLAAWAALHRFPYPAEQLTQGWRDLCVNQFHDIACGCSYAEAHREDRVLFDETARRAGWVTEQAAAFLCHLLHAHRAATSAEDRAYAVFDTVAWPHITPVILPVQTQEPVAVSDANGARIRAQRIVQDDGKPGMLILHEADGAGLAEYSLTPGGPDEDAVALAQPYLLENELLRIEFDPMTGEIVRLTDKRAQTECLPPGGRANRLVFLEEANLIPGGPEHSWQPWNIQYTGRELPGGTVTRIEVREVGPVRGVIRIERRVQLAADLPETRVIQDVMLYRDSPLVYFATHGEWHARQVMLKATFDLPFAATRVTVEAPYGVADRAPHGETRHTGDADNLLEDRRSPGVAIPEPDRYMQKWLDITDGGRGILFLNNGLNGYHATASELGLSLLRAPLMRPERDEIIGLGAFDLGYALMPHAGDWRTVNAPRLGYEFNTRPIVAPIQDGRNDGVGCAWWRVVAGRTPPIVRFLSVDGPGILLTAAKHAESGDALIVRLFESLGYATRATLTCPTEVESAAECDLLERPLDDPDCALDSPAEIRVGGARLELNFTPFEIKTVRIRLRAGAA